MAGTGTVMPMPIFTGWDDNGDPLNGGKLFTYEAGTTTNLATYSDSALTVANANPVILSSAGRAVVYLSPTSYKFVLKTSADVTIWTQDNVAATPPAQVDLDITGTAGETLAAGDVVYMSAGDGGRTAGRWYKADADLTYASTEADALGMMPASLLSSGSGSIRLVGRITGLAGLTAGSVYYISGTAGALTATPPANARALAVADSSTTVLMSQWLPIPDASATLPGIVSIGTQTLAGAKTLSGPTTLSGLTTFSVAPIGGRRFTRCTADFIKNANTTLGDITGMSIPIAANETLVFEFVLHGVSTVTADWKFSVTFPAGTVGSRFGFTGTSTIGETSEDVSGAPLILSSTSFEDCIHIHGIIRNGANAGNIVPQMAQNTSDATNTVIRADSHGSAERIA